MNLTIEHAKKIGRELGATGSVIIVFDSDGKFGVASYGITKR